MGGRVTDATPNHPLLSASPRLSSPRRSSPRLPAQRAPLVAPQPERPPFSSLRLRLFRRAQQTAPGYRTPCTSEACPQRSPNVTSCSLLIPDPGNRSRGQSEARTRELTGCKVGTSSKSLLSTGYKVGVCVKKKLPVSAGTSQTDHRRPGSHPARASWTAGPLAARLDPAKIETG